MTMLFRPGPHRLSATGPPRPAKPKLIRYYAVSDAAVHDSQEQDRPLHKGNTCNDVFAVGR
jgi:hypothetical protein